MFPVCQLLNYPVKSFLLSSSPLCSQFQLGEVCQFAAHQENGRLMGFVVEGRDWSEGNEEGEPSFSAFVFESNTEGEKVGATLSEEEHDKTDTAQIDIEVYHFIFIHRYVTP